MRGRHKGERTLANRAVLAHQLGATGAKVVHWATHWDPPWSRWSTDAGVVVLKTRPNPITVRIESSHPLSFPGIARSSSCRQMVQWHAAQHLLAPAHRGGGAGFSARGTDRALGAPTTRACTVGGAAAAVWAHGRAHLRPPRRATAATACQRTAVLGGITSGRISTSPPDRSSYRSWGS